MTTYAHIASGIVAELFTPPAEVAIGACFHPDLVWIECDGTPGVAPGWSAVETGGVWSFTAPPAPPAPSLAQQAQVLLSAGLTIASTGTPAINGTYACDAATRATVAEVVAGINAGDGFPGNGGTFDFALANGSVVTFPATAAFLAVGKALRDFIYACNQVITGRSGSLPVASVTIA